MKELITIEDFTQVRRCSKAAYLNRKHPELADKNMIPYYKGAEEIQVILEKTLQPNGTRISKFSSPIERDQKTREALSKRGTIHMATFISKDNELVEINTLQKSERTTAWILKTDQSDLNGADIWSACYKSYVLNKCGVKVDRFLIVYLNPAYVHSDENKQPLFLFKNVTKKCTKRFSEVERYLTRLKKSLASDTSPGVIIGYQCPMPKCVFYKHCWSAFTESSVFEFFDMSFPQKFRLYSQGYENMVTVPANTRLTAAEKIQLECHKRNQPHTNKRELKKFFDTLSKFPKHLYLDINTTKVLLPQFKGSQPFETSPYQFSVVNVANGTTCEEKFTINPKGLYDVRLEFLKKLLGSLEPGTNYPIITWKSVFIKHYLKGCQRVFPFLQKDIERIIDRLYSVCQPFEDHYFYHPKLAGRDDFWAVSKVLAPEELTTKNEVSNNRDAQMTFEKMKTCSLREYWVLQENLEKYSLLKARCLIKILENLKKYL